MYFVCRKINMSNANPPLELLILKWVLLTSNGYYCDNTLLLSLVSFIYQKPTFIINKNH